MQPAWKTESDQTCCGSTLRSLGLALAVHAVGLALIFLLWLLLPVPPVAATVGSQRPPAGESGAVRLVSQEVTAAVPSRESRLLGVWRDYYRGERTLTLNADGTGQMVVVLAGFAKKMFAERLSFEVDWSLDGDLLIMETRSGQPESKFQLIRKLYGDRAEYNLLSVDPQLMRWRDAGGKTEYEWSRLEPDAP